MRKRLPTELIMRLVRIMIRRVAREMRLSSLESRGPSSSLTWVTSLCMLLVIWRLGCTVTNVPP